MSGICGIIHFDGAPVSSERLETMLSAAPYRAREGVGRWIETSVAFGYLATEVAPVDERCDQPLVDSEAGLVLIAHARLDNRDDLQHALEQAGVLHARIPSSAELILGAYQQWGVNAAERLIGDFAFVLWDAKEQRLFAARDPMAMRPLYYHRQKNMLAFGSEVKQILTLPQVPDVIRDEAIATYLVGRFNDLSGTYFEDIHQLPPAHALLVTSDSMRSWKYWEADPHLRIRYKTEEEYVEHFRELLIEAARVRFRSPQPAGLFLSGGLDSGSVASVAGLLKQQGELECPDVHTYSWAFPTLPQCDERSLSDQIVTHYDLPATYIDAEEHAPLKTYPEVVPDPDGPFMGVYDGISSAALRQARDDGVGYMFSGHRADLLIGEWIFNYLDLFRTGRWISLWKDLRAHQHYFGVPARQMWKRYFWNPIRSSLWPHHRLPRTREVARRLWHSLNPARDDESPFPSWMAPELVASLPRFPREKPPPAGLDSYARRRRYKSIFVPLHMHVATSTELMCARHHIVASDIWTDRRLLQFVLSVPPDVLCRAGENKRLLRWALKGILPEPVRLQASKVNPRPLYERALKRHDDLITNVLFTNSRSGQQGYIDEAALRRHYEAFLGGEDLNYHFWYALAVEMWLRSR